jgi:hypothetical protein
MPIDAIVRVSFESNVNANQAVNRALVGVPQGAHGPGPFSKVGTAVYSVHGGNEVAVGAAIAELGAALAGHAATLDFFSVSLVRV